MDQLQGTVNQSVDTIEPVAPEKGWRFQRAGPSLPEVYRSVKIPNVSRNWWGLLRKLLAFSGPGYMVAVGYMDPGNWATDIAGGSRFAYTLLSVVLLSNMMAILLQSLAVKLGVATGRDLAQACRDHYSKRVSMVLWFLCEVAIAACDLAEVIGSAIALNLLFGIPLIVGVVITVFDVLVILFFQYKGFRYIESIIAGLITVIFFCFAYEIAVSKPEIASVISGLIPTAQIVTDHRMLYI